MSEARTNIVISSWNALEFTQNALNRVSTTAEEPYYLTVVDNASSDGTREFLQGFKPSVRCIGYKAILNSSNLGPGRAYQQGYEVSRNLSVPYTVLSNNDVHYQSAWLSKLETAMDERPEIGIMGTLQPVSTMIHPYFRAHGGKDILQSAPTDMSIEEELDYFFAGNSFDDGASASVDTNGGGINIIPSPPDAIPTSCAIVRNAAAERVGYIADPRYEIYGSEDIDFSWELGRLGLACAMNNDVYVHHFRHRSSTRSGLNINESLRINNKKFVEKWYETISILLRDTEVAARFEDAGARDEWTKLRRINNNVGFFKDGHLIPKDELFKA